MHMLVYNKHLLFNMYSMNIKSTQHIPTQMHQHMSQGMTRSLN